MSQDISSVVPLSLNIGGSGMTNANYASAVVFADQLDLAPNITFTSKTNRDYASLAAVAADFATSSEVYQIASKWFAAATNRASFSIYMKDSTVAPLDNVNGFASQKWRYFQLLKEGDVTKDTLPGLASWCDANSRGLPLFLTDANNVSSGTDDLSTLAFNLQYRHVFPCYRSAASFADSHAEVYSYAGVLAKFSKFDPEGIETAIDTEYQSVSAVGDNLSTDAVNALKRKKVAYFTRFIASGEETSAVPVNTWSTSPNGETVDDVYNTDVLSNELQVASFNYLSTSGYKRSYTTKSFSGLISSVKTVLKKFKDNGVLGEGYVDDLSTGNQRYLDNGYWVNNEPSDVLNASTSQRHERRYPTLDITVILARSGRKVNLSLNVE